MAKKIPWASHRYNEARKNPDLLQTKEAAAYLGVAVGWLRKHVRYTEWHHCYLTKYGGAAIAYYWSKEDLDAYAKLHPDEVEAVRKRKQKRLERK